MIIRYSRKFEKQTKKLDTITQRLLFAVIEEIKQLESIESIPNCLKLSGYKKAYRIRISDHRAIFIHEEENTIFFEYIASRGEAYDKKYQNLIKGK